MALSWIGETKAKQILLISNCCHRCAAFQLLCTSTLQILLSKMYVWKSYNFIRQQFTHYKMFAVPPKVYTLVWMPDCISLWNKWFPEMLRYGRRTCELSIVHGCRKWFVLCTLVKIQFYNPCMQVQHTLLYCWHLGARSLQSSIIKLDIILQLQAVTNMPGQNTNIIIL